MRECGGSQEVFSLSIPSCTAVLPSADILPRWSRNTFRKLKLQGHLLTHLPYSPADAGCCPEPLPASHYLQHQSSYLHLTPEATPQLPPFRVHTPRSTAHTLPSWQDLPYSGPPTHSEASSFHFSFRVLLPAFLE